MLNWLNGNLIFFSKILKQTCTLDALSASDLLLREREEREREQQGKSGLNRIKK